MDKDFKLKLQELVEEERAAGTSIQDIIAMLTEETVTLTSEDLEDAEEDDEDTPPA